MAKELTCVPFTVVHVIVLALIAPKAKRLSEMRRKQNFPLFADTAAEMGDRKNVGAPPESQTVEPKAPSYMNPILLSLALLLITPLSVRSADSTMHGDFKSNSKLHWNCTWISLLKKTVPSLK